jgi:hypothetical protein
VWDHLLLLLRLHCCCWLELLLPLVPPLLQAPSCCIGLPMLPSRLLLLLLLPRPP